jgi:cytochrome P450 family 6
MLFVPVFTETLRRYPVLPFMDRTSLCDYELPAPNGTGTVTLPAGTAVYIPSLALHNDPTYYPEPEKFDPERFTEENKLRRPNYTYLAFGEGPRMCVGKDRYISVFLDTRGQKTM